MATTITASGNAAANNQAACRYYPKCARARRRLWNSFWLIWIEQQIRRTRQGGGFGGASKRYRQKAISSALAQNCAELYAKTATFRLRGGCDVLNRSGPDARR